MAIKGLIWSKILWTCNIPTLHNLKVHVDQSVCRMFSTEVAFPGNLPLITDKHYSPVFWD